MTTVLFFLSLVLLVVTCLPLLTFLRLARVLAEVRSLRLRVSALEDELRTIGAQPRAAAPQSTPAADVTAGEPAAEPPAKPFPAAGVPARDEEAASPGHGAPPVEELEPEAAADVHPAGPPAPAPDLLPASAAAAASSTHQAGTLEEAIGGRLLLYVGTVVVVLGVAYFLKYAFDRQWITEAMRVVLGGLAGIALVTGGLRLAGRGYAVYGQMLTGGGLAALYLSVYAAFGFYGLIGRETALVLLLAVTVAAALLADRYRSQGMALMAVGGGYLTPFLVGGSEDAQIALFTYVALLVGGTMYLARRRQWPWLNVLAYVCTVLVVAAWADAHYTRAKYVRTELFLTLYCVMFLLILRSSRSEAAAGARLVLWTAPAAYHAASLAVLAPHGVALLVYLIAFSLAGVVIGIRTNRSDLRLSIWGAAWIPLMAWLDAHHGRAWVWPGVVTLAAVFALHAVAQLDRIFRRESPLDRVDLVLVHLNGLGALAGVYVLLAERSLSQVLVLGAILVAAHLALAARWRAQDRAASLNALGVAFALVTALIGIELDGTWLTAAFAAEGAAIMAIGVQLDRQWFRLGGTAVLVFAAARWLVFSVPDVPVNFRLVFNRTFLLGAWIIALMYAAAWWHRRRGRVRYGTSIAALLVAASVLTVILLSAENASYWNLRGDFSSDATFAARLALSLIWTFYAGVLIAVGFRLKYAPIRYTAIALFALTIAKVFLVDLSGLQGIYRVLGLIVVGTVLLVVSFFYQRKRQADAALPAEGPPGG